VIVALYGVLAVMIVLAVGAWREYAKRQWIQEQQQLRIEAQRPTGDALARKLRKIERFERAAESASSPAWAQELRDHARFLRQQIEIPARQDRERPGSSEVDSGEGGPTDVTPTSELRRLPKIPS
jgi:hypothetical protein